MSATVAQLALAPVKGMQLVAVDSLDLDAHGAAGDRAFYVLGPGHVLISTERAPGLLGVRPGWDAARGVLTLRFPDGSEVAEAIAPGEPAVTTAYNGRRIAGRLVDGAPASALSEHLGRPVRLLARDPGQAGPVDYPVSLMAEASVAALAPELGGAAPDPRRFRMNVAVAGAAAWEEHGWVGREIAVGNAVLRAAETVPRCVLTTLDPASGERDVPVLRALARLRGPGDVKLGLWCEVAAPGRVRVGDRAAPL